MYEPSDAEHLATFTISTKISVIYDYRLDNIHIWKIPNVARDVSRQSSIMNNYNEHALLFYNSNS